MALPCNVFFSLQASSHANVHTDVTGNKSIANFKGERSVRSLKVAGITGSNPVDQSLKPFGNRLVINRENT